MIVAKLALTNKTVRGLLGLGILYLTSETFTWLGHAADKLPDAEPILAIGLWTVGNVLHGLFWVVLSLLALGLIFKHGAALFNWLAGMIGFDTPSNNSVHVITHDLAQTVSDLEQYGSRSGVLVRSTELQTMALVEVVKELAKTAAHYEKTGNSLRAALQAVVAKDFDQIAILSGEVPDQEISSFLMQANEQARPSYWNTLRQIIGTQIGVTNRAQDQYDTMVVDIMLEIAMIKKRLSVVRSHLKMAEAAPALAVAQNNLEIVTELLKVPSNEPPKIMGLLPKNTKVIEG